MDKENIAMHMEDISLKVSGKRAAKLTSEPDFAVTKYPSQIYRNAIFPTELRHCSVLFRNIHSFILFALSPDLFCH